MQKSRDRLHFTFFSAVGVYISFVRRGLTKLFFLSSLFQDLIAWTWMIRNQGLPHHTRCKVIQTTPFIKTCRPMPSAPQLKHTVSDKPGHSFHCRTITNMMLRALALWELVERRRASTPLTTSHTRYKKKRGGSRKCHATEPTFFIWTIETPSSAYSLSIISRHTTDADQYTPCEPLCSGPGPCKPDSARESTHDSRCLVLTHRRRSRKGNRDFPSPLLDSHPALPATNRCYSRPQCHAA